MAGPDLGVLRRCVGFCERAYGESSLHSELAHCLVVWGRDGGDVTVAFRGSHSARDWLTDFDVRRVPAVAVGPGIRAEDFMPGGRAAVGLQWGCRVHAGFMQSALSIVEQVRRLDQREVKARLTVTGHSLGGALAVLVAWLLAGRGWVAESVVTFGGPRVGDGAWRRAYGGVERGALWGRTWRVVNGADVVCRVPSWCAGWRHVGREVFLPAIGGMVTGPRLWLKVLSDLAGTYREWTQGRVAQLADHPVQNYVGAVRAI